MRLGEWPRTPGQLESPFTRTFSRALVSSHCGFLLHHEDAADEEFAKVSVNVSLLLESIYAGVRNAMSDILDDLSKELLRE